MATRIENPLLNSPFETPTRHFRFDEQGITSTIDESRRCSAYFMPIAQPKKKGEQKTFETEWTVDRIKETTEVNRIRERVDARRAGGYVSVTSTMPAPVLEQPAVRAEAVLLPAGGSQDRPRDQESRKV
jgi:type III restriction enzyme